MYCMLGLALLVWTVIAVLRGSIFLSIALFFVATCAFPAEFFSFDAAGLTWTLDRVGLVGIAVQFAVRWYRGELQIARIEPLDFALGLFFTWLVARTVTQPLGSVIPAQPPTLMHLVNGYLIPFFLYAVLRTSNLELQKIRPALSPPAVVNPSQQPRPK